MKTISLLLLGLLLAFTQASDVLDLTEENFDQTLQENSVILVEFYAPWCGHCKNLAPKYETAATQLKGIAPIAKVDCTAQEALCSRFGIRGYPTMKIFRDGNPSEYNAAREVDAIVSFMKKQVLPAISVLEGDKIQEFIDSDRVVVIGFFENTESREYKVFAEVAGSLRDDYLFGATTDAAAASTFGASVPGVILFKKFDERKNIFEDTFSKSELKSFIKTNAIPVMDDIGPENYGKFVESGLPLAYLFVTPENREESGKLVEPIAKEFKGQMNFVYIDAVKYGNHASNLGLKVGNWPAFSIQKPSENSKFPHFGALETEAIRTLVQNVLNGEAESFMKSEEIPTEQGNVHVVVGKSYNDVVSQGKDVLIEFYAPWCGHCKKLAPIYDELGDLYASNENIIIAKMDATENDLPAGTPFTVQGFPTIKFIKADGTVVDYSGDRTLEDFKSFIDKNASVKVSAKVEKDEL